MGEASKELHHHNDEDSYNADCNDNPNTCKKSFKFGIHLILILLRLFLAPFPVSVVVIQSIGMSRRMLFSRSIQIFVRFLLGTARLRKLNLILNQRLMFANLLNFLTAELDCLPI